MRQLRTAVLALIALAPMAQAQRTVNTGTQPARKTAWEVGFDPITLEFGTDDPQYLDLHVGGSFLRNGTPRPVARAAMFFAPNMAIDARFGWFSSAEKRSTGFSAYSFDFGLLYGLTDLDPGTKAMYVRPGIMINSVSTPGSRSFTTLSGAFGMRRPWHGVIVVHEVQLNRQLDSGPIAAKLYVDFRAGITVRL